MKQLHHTNRLPIATWILPMLLLVGCSSGEDSHEGHDHDAGQEHEDAHEDESGDEHAGHDHDEEDSK